MKAMKTTVTAALAALLLACALAAQAVALAKYTLMDPSFFGAGERSAYDLAAQALVRKLSDGVLAAAPPIALKTMDPDEAYALACQALPPGEVSALLQSSAPDLDRFVFSGGDIPVLKGSEEIGADEQAAVKNLLMPEAQSLVQQGGQSLPTLPFTPAWNQANAQALVGSLWATRYYAGFSTQTLWMAVAGVVLAAGLMYLTWLKERGPFFRAAGSALAANGLLLLAPALALSFCNDALAKAFATLPGVSGVAAFFGSVYPELFRAAFRPFREIFFAASLTTLALAVTVLATGVSSEGAGALPPVKPWLLPKSKREKDGMNWFGVKKPRHVKP